MTESNLELVPSTDLRSLDRLVGTWKVSDPSGKGAIDGEVTYQWLDGGFFLMQQFDFVHGGRKLKYYGLKTHRLTKWLKPVEG